MVFLKIEKDKLVAAPYEIKRDGKRIFGYNKENNEQMLIQDGYQKFPKTASDYKIINGKIEEVKNEEDAIIEEIDEV